MKVKATSTIIAFDGGQMVVINAGETGELSDALAETEIASGKAVAVKGKGKASEVAEAPESEEAGETVVP